MKLSFAAFSCRQLRRALLTANRTPHGRPRIMISMSTQKRFTTTFTADQTFQGFDHTTPEVQPVVDGLSDDDILHQDTSFAKTPIEKRIQSPSEGSSTCSIHYSEIMSSVEENYDQDYDEYTLHMSSFQAYNSTRESLPDLDTLQHGDVRNLEEVEEYWESNPNAFHGEQLAPIFNSNGPVPDVEDI
jgi:hypothetical protein